MRRNLDGYTVAVMDFETDPFFPGRIPQPFAGQFKSSDGIRITKWGKDCVAELMAEVLALDAHYLIYIHNGGRFDFHFLYDYVEPPIFIIHGRLVEFSLGVNSKRKAKHVFRDSLAIIPVALAEYQKEEIDYRIFEKAERDKPNNKRKILAYLDSDCDNLLEICFQFVKRFGPKITVGSTAMGELRKFYDFERCTERQDEIFRPYYYGGRNQCFAAGIVKGPWKLYDVNSEYPSAMRNFRHPVNCKWESVMQLPKRGPYFVYFTGTNHNALPTRRDNKTEFNEARGTFFACSHEFVPAVKYGMVEVEVIHEIWKPIETTTFKKYVDYWYREKAEAKKREDKPGELFAKFMLNSAYGKFGQNPREYRNYLLVRDIFCKQLEDNAELEDGDPMKWELEQALRPDLELWSRPAFVHSGSFYDVSIAASITSAARSIMLEGLRAAVEPIYCDTDSVICRGFTGHVDDLELGAWKHETWIPPGEKKKVPIVADFAAIAGRKTYCLYNMDGRKFIPIKWASKGGDLTPREIVNIAKGAEIEKTNEVPTFSLIRPTQFISRTFRKTVDERISAF